MVSTEDLPKDRQAKRYKLPRPQYALIECVVGPDRLGPKRCIQCHEPFKNWERWHRFIAPAGPLYGAYIIGLHIKCIQW